MFGCTISNVLACTYTFVVANRRDGKGRETSCPNTCLFVFGWHQASFGSNRAFFFLTLEEKYFFVNGIFNTALSHSWRLDSRKNNFLFFYSTRCDTASQLSFSHSSKHSSHVSKTNSLVSTILSSAAEIPSPPFRVRHAGKLKNFKNISEKRKSDEGKHA